MGFFSDTIGFLDENSSLGASGLIRAIAFIVLGASGTYLLLPHAHGHVKPARAPTWPARRMPWQASPWACSCRCSVKAGPIEVATGFFFYPMAALALIGAVLTITSKNPIHSALVVRLGGPGHVGPVPASRGAQFLAAGTVIVYAGAIIVTFLFVIMLAQMEGRATYDRIRPRAVHWPRSAASCSCSA